MKISDLNREFLKHIGNRFITLRKQLILSLKKVSQGSGIPVSTLKKIEKGEGMALLKNLPKLINFYSIEYPVFFDFSIQLPNEKELKQKMIKFHKEHESNAHEILFHEIDLIDLLELRLLDSTLFEDWVEVKDVDSYVETGYGIKYDNTSGTLLTAVKKGWLISKRKYVDNEKARVNEYKKNPLYKGIYDIY